MWTWELGHLRKYVHRIGESLPRRIFEAAHVPVVLQSPLVNVPWHLSLLAMEVGYNVVIDKCSNIVCLGVNRNKPCVKAFVQMA